MSASGRRWIWLCWIRPSTTPSACIRGPLVWRTSGTVRSPRCTRGWLTPSVWLSARSGLTWSIRDMSIPPGLHTVRTAGGGATGRSVPHARHWIASGNPLSGWGRQRSAGGPQALLWGVDGGPSAPHHPHTPPLLHRHPRVLEVVEERFPEDQDGNLWGGLPQ